MFFAALAAYDSSRSQIVRMEFYDCIRRRRSTRNRQRNARPGHRQVVVDQAHRQLARRRRDQPRPRRTKCVQGAPCHRNPEEGQKVTIREKAGLGRSDPVDADARKPSTANFRSPDSIVTGAGKVIFQPFLVFTFPTARYCCAYGFTIAGAGSLSVLVAIVPVSFNIALPFCLVK